MILKSQVLVEKEVKNQNSLGYVHLLRIGIFVHRHFCVGTTPRGILSYHAMGIYHRNFLVEFPVALRHFCLFSKCVFEGYKSRSDSANN